MSVSRTLPAGRPKTGVSQIVRLHFSRPAPGPSMVPGDRINPWAVIEQLRANPNVGLEEREAIEAAHSMFERAGSACAHDEALMEALAVAFAYGTIIGSYVTASDPTLPREVTKLLGSLAGRKSGEARHKRPWHEPATAIVTKLCEQHPKWSQEKLAEQIAERLKDVLPKRKDRVGIDTLKDFISGLEREGKLWRRR